jgi:hypothetical protein
MKIFYTLSGNQIYSRNFDTEEDAESFRSWVEEQGGDTEAM